MARYMQDARVLENGHHVYRVRCSCGAVDEFMPHTHTGTLPDNAIAKKFIARGWEIGRKAKSDRCPACIQKAKDERRIRLVASEGVTMPMPEFKQPAPVRADPPPVLDVDAALLIADRLDDIYDPKTGYPVGKGDNTIADELGVPRDWVTQVRRKKFGNGPEPDELKRLRDELKNLEAAHAQAASIIKTAQARQKEVDDALGKLRERLNRIYEAVR